MFYLFLDMQSDHMHLLLNDRSIKQAIVAQMSEKALEYGLSGIEKVRDIHLTDIGFTPFNDLVTPTFKLKRFNAKKQFMFT